MSPAKHCQYRLPGGEATVHHFVVNSSQTKMEGAFFAPSIIFLPPAFTILSGESCALSYIVTRSRDEASGYFTVCVCSGSKGTAPLSVTTVEFTVLMKKIRLYYCTVQQQRVTVEYSRDHVTCSV